MTAVFFLLLIALQYGITIWAIRNQRYEHLVCVYIYSLFTYDYIFINASYHLPGAVVGLLKPYSEYLIGYFLYHLYFRQRQRISPANPMDSYMIWLIGAPTLVALLVNDLLLHRAAGDTVLGLRLYLVPLLLGYLLYRCDILQRTRQLAIVNTIFICSIASGIYGFFQKAYFNGNVQTFWFHDFFNRYAQNPIDFGPANYIRDYRLRVTGYFVSPITYSVAFCLPIFVVFTMLANSAHRMTGHIRFLLISFLAFFLYFQWQSVTRIGLIVDFIGLLIIILAKLKRPKLFWLAAVPAGVVAATFGTLLIKTNADASALGRLDQYQAFLKYFQFFGLGFNHELVRTHFDTWFVSIGLLYGAFVIFPLLFLFKIFRAAYGIVRAAEGNYLLEGAYFSGLTFIYTFCFQFMAGSTPYHLFFFLLFVILAHDNSGLNRQLKAADYRLIPY